jgi:hypothetical protein
MCKISSLFSFIKLFLSGFCIKIFVSTFVPVWFCIKSYTMSWEMSVLYLSWSIFCIDIRLKWWYLQMCARTLHKQHLLCTTSCSVDIHFIASTTSFTQVWPASVLPHLPHPSRFLSYWVSAIALREAWRNP